MPTNKTITINGRAYDAVTGLPISERVYDQVSRVNNGKPTSKVAPAAVKAAAKEDAKEEKQKHVVERDSATAATAVHSQTQRSATLVRRASKKPAAPAKRPTTGRHMDMARSTKISRFAPHPVTAAPTTTAKAAAVKPVGKPVVADVPDKPAKMHPVAKKAVARVEAAKPVATKPATSKEVKDAAIANALTTPKVKAAKNKKVLKKSHKGILITLAVFIVIATSVYAVYRFVPAVSVSIAASQAGVDASYPEFVPDGYSLDHPVTYSDGQVELKFKQNGNKENNYTISQTRSSWDSSAVLDNVVRPAAGDNYITTKERGLTVYSYGNNAAWVNGGVLYVIASSSAPLSGEQIRHIATSL
jgi:hypothetical protein